MSTMSMSERRNYFAFPGTINKKFFPKKEIYLRDLFGSVCEFHNYSQIDFNMKSRKRELVEIRQKYCFLAKKFTDKSLNTIAYIIQKDHSTIVHSISEVTNLMATNKKYSLNVNKLENFVRNKFGI